MDQRGLRDILVTNFNDGELRDLCFDLGIDYESLPGEGKAAKARELVAYCQRHGRLPDLETTCRRMRPNAFQDSQAAPAGPTPAAPGAQGQPGGERGGKGGL